MAAGGIIYFNCYSVYTGLVCYRSIEICVGKPGQPEKKIKVLPNCTIRELRRMVEDRMGVASERQHLVYNGKVLVDENPETKEETILTGILEMKGNVTNPNFMSGTPWKICHYALKCNNSSL